MIVEGIEEGEKRESVENTLAYLFGLLLIYGKWEAKDKELSSIKSQIPLAGQHLAHAETLDMIIKKLQDTGLFLKADKLANKNGMVYQISSNDYELLEIWAKRYEAVEKFEKITTTSGFLSSKMLELQHGTRKNPQFLYYRPY